MGARPYDPSLGRFLAVDPIDGGSLNFYDYSNQDPINGYDLSGDVPSWLCKAGYGLAALGLACEQITAKPWEQMPDEPVTFPSSSPNARGSVRAPKVENTGSGNSGSSKFTWKNGEGPDNEEPGINVKPGSGGSGTLGGGEAGEQTIGSESGGGVEQGGNYLAKLL